MNHSIYSADRTTHLKVVIVALIAGILVAGFGISMRNSSDECQIAPKCDPLFAAKNDPFDGAETGGAEPHIAEQSRSWRAASGEREVMRGS